MEFAGIIETVRSRIYKILYKWGYKIGHLIAKISSWSFLEGVRNAFNQTISEEMNINLGADNFANIFDTVATGVVRDLALEINSEIENSQGNIINEDNLEEWNAQAMEELHIERTVHALKILLENPGSNLTMVTLQEMEANPNGEVPNLPILHATEFHNESKSPEAKEILAHALCQDNTVVFYILDTTGQTVSESVFKRVQDQDGKLCFELVS